MEKRIKGVAILVIILLLAIVGLVGYFGWVNIANVDTLHARIESDMAQVRAPIAGRVSGCTLDIGDPVALDDELTTIETSSTTARPGARVIVPIRAPMDGLVAASAIQPGDTVTAGQTLMTIVDPNRFWVTAMVHESRVPQVRVGQRVRVRVRARTWRRRFWGQVDQIGAATSAAVAGQNASTTARPEIPVRVSFDPAGYQLFPGMTVDVRIRLDPRQW